MPSRCAGNATFSALIIEDWKNIEAAERERENKFQLGNRRRRRHVMIVYVAIACVRESSTRPPHNFHPSFLAKHQYAADNTRQPCCRVH